MLSPSDQLIFTSFDNHKLIIKTKTVLTLNDFLPNQQDIIFKGTAMFIVEEGSSIIFGQNKLIATQNARIFFVKSSG